MTSIEQQLAEIEARDEVEAREWLMSERLPELLNSGGVVYDLRDIYIRIAAHIRTLERERAAKIAESLYTKVNGIGIAAAIRDTVYAQKK